MNKYIIEKVKCLGEEISVGTITEYCWKIITKCGETFKLYSLEKYNDEEMVNKQIEVIGEFFVLQNA